MAKLESIEEPRQEQVGRCQATARQAHHQSHSATTPGHHAESFNSFNSFKPLKQCQPLPARQQLSQPRTGHPTKQELQQLPLLRFTILKEQQQSLQPQQLQPQQLQS